MFTCLEPRPGPCTEYGGGGGPPKATGAWPPHQDASRTRLPMRSLSCSPCMNKWTEQRTDSRKLMLSLSDYQRQLHNHHNIHNHHHLFTFMCITNFKKAGCEARRPQETTRLIAEATSTILLRGRAAETTILAKRV